MHTTRRLTITYLALAAALLGLFALNLFWGSVAISPRGVVQALLGRRAGMTWPPTFCCSCAAPRAVMVVLLGAALRWRGICCKLFCQPPLRGRSLWAFPAGQSWWLR